MDTSVNADVLAERRLVRRVFVAMAIVIPILAAFTALLVFISARMAGVSAGPPVAMGVGIGVLSGVFFGMWAGVVASVNDIEHVEYPEIETDHKVIEQSEGGDAACWAHLVCPECGGMHESSVHES